MSKQHNHISGSIVDAAYHIHRNMGPGLLENVYETVLFHVLIDKGLKVERQVRVPVTYGKYHFEEGFRADLIINNKVIVELKSVEALIPSHKKQLLTYLRLTGLHLGLLINFGESLFKNGIHRIVNQLEPDQ
jgi:GxxExxY protein